MAHFNGVFRTVRITSFKEGNEAILTINTTGGKGLNYYSITVNGESILNSSSSNSVTWKPEKAGTYKFVLHEESTDGIFDYLYKAHESDIVVNVKIVVKKNLI